MKKLSAVVIALGLVLSGVNPAYAETDPFPGVEHMAEIPNTRISSALGQTESDWHQTDAFKSFSCPAGAGNGISVNVGNGVRSIYCVKTWRSQSNIDALQKYNDDKAAAQASALAQSLAWNTANPGQQRCFQWGPITSPEGGTASGGVCANPVSGPAPISETVTRTVQREDTGVFETTQTSSRVSAFLTSVQALPSVTNRALVNLPKIKQAKRLGISMRTVSRSPNVCTVRKSKVRFVGSGDCRVRIVITDSSGNRLVSNLRVSRA